MAELADAADSKSADRKVMGVRPPLPAPQANIFKINRLQDIEIVRAKIVPKTCQDCAKLPLSGITKSSTINGEVYDSITSKNCNVCPREQSERQRPNGFRSFLARVSRIADARCVAFAIRCARGVPDLGNRASARPGAMRSSGPNYRVTFQ